MSLLCGGGGAAAEGTPEELEANRKLMQMQKTEEERETKVSSQNPAAHMP